jgi:two-component system OmpR family response regulator
VQDTSPAAAAATTQSPHVLLVEDDEEISTLVARYLVGHGLRVSEVRTGNEALGVVEAGRVDVVLLDLGLPGEDGLAILRSLRSRHAIPVIIVSGRGEAVERVVGLELGPDDFVSKPFDFRELLARIRSVLRRAARGPDVEQAREEVQYFEDLHLDRCARRLMRASGDEIALSSGEFALLSTLAEKPGHVFSRDALMQALHGHDAGPFDRTIDVQVARLRRKIEADPEHPRIIKSVRGVGYVFAAKTRHGT